MDVNRFRDLELWKRNGKRITASKGRYFGNTFSVDTRARREMLRTILVAVVSLAERFLLSKLLAHSNQQEEYGMLGCSLVMSATQAMLRPGGVATRRPGE